MSPRNLVILLSGVATVASVITHASTTPTEPGIEGTYAEHTRGVGLARAGRYDDGLAVLLPLLTRFPDDYPLQRDVILITVWKGDCPDALKRFETIRDRPGLETYLVVPVSDCLLSENRPREARRLTRLALQQSPDDAQLRNAYLKADVALRVDGGIEDERPVIEAELYNNSSDQGLVEWIGGLEGSAQVAEGNRLYARYRLTRSIEQAYQAGDLNRLGVGVHYRFDERWRVDQEFSADLYASGQGGSTTRVVYDPRDAWRFLLSYASFAEDTPLRARAAGIEASHWAGEASWEARDYRMNWSASLGGYDFSDTNQRLTFFTAFGYAWEMRPDREQRLFVEWYQSSNSLQTGAPYFNPTHDYSLGLTHRTDFVMTSTRFQRHVDHLYVYAGLYAQEGYTTRPRWSLRYEQDYDLNAKQGFVVGAGFGRNVYDGQYENEWQFTVRFRQRL